MSSLKDELRELKAQLKQVKSQPDSPEIANERGMTAELIREWESKLLIQKATRWGIEVPDREDWYSHETRTGTQTVVFTLPYLNQTATAVLTHRIREAKMAYWKGWSEILITILSLIVAILALLLRR